MGRVAESKEGLVEEDTNGGEKREKVEDIGRGKESERKDGQALGITFLLERGALSGAGFMSFRSMSSDHIVSHAFFWWFRFHPMLGCILLCYTLICFFSIISSLFLL